MKAAEHTESRIGQVLKSARLHAGLGLRQAARLGTTSHATLNTYEKGGKTPVASTLIRLLESYHYRVDLSVIPRIRSKNGLERGEELSQVLELAAQFPANPQNTLAFPPFSRSGTLSKP